MNAIDANRLPRHRVSNLRGYMGLTFRESTQRTSHMASSTATSFPRYEADETPAPLTTLGLGVQSALLTVTPVVMFPIILAQSAGAPGEFSDWAVFAMLVVCGAATVVLSYRFGPVGSGMLVVPYPSPSALPFCILALQQGGAGTLAGLLIAYAAFQIVASLRMALLRRLVTPAISGAILILLTLTLVPVVFRGLGGAPAGAPSYAGPLCILAISAVTLALLIRGSNNWRVWASIIGIVAGSVVAVATGIYDFGPATSAPAVGLPMDGWPGLSLPFNSAFWSLLPVFLFLSAVSVLQGNSIVLATQRLSWRSPRAMDYRRVQGANIGTGLFNLVGGLAAVMPIAIGPRGAAFVQQTGCASRHIGVITGVLLVVAAFFPKVWSLLLGIPAPVVAVYILILIAPLIVEGMKLILQDAPDYRVSLVVGLAIVVGLGLQAGLVSLPVAEAWESALQKAVTGGGIVLLVLTAFAEFRRRRREHLRLDMRLDELPRLNRFMEQFSTRRGWSEPMTARLQAVAEETLHILLEGREGAREDERPRRLVVDAASTGATADLEFKSVAGSDENLEDRMSLLSRQMPVGSELELPALETLVERDAALRLLRHYAASVSHTQYFDVEIITVRVTPPAG